MKVKPEEKLEGEVKVASFLVGFTITSGDRVSLLTTVEGFADNAATIKATAEADTKISALQFCVVFSNYANFFASETLGDHLDDTHSWM